MLKTLPDVDFHLIRSLRGKQTEGFEELTVQLFREETKGQGEFFRVNGAGGDEGVEAYLVKPSGKKIGFQSKFFDKLKASQWVQIAKSVKTALKKHPTILRYVIAVPLDCTPEQIKKWNSSRKEWIKYAKTLGIKRVEFVWWGRSELIGLLSERRYQRHAVYWLGLPDFTNEWLDRINSSHIASLGKRYSPKQHIKTESGSQLEAFAWGEDGKALIRKAFVRVVEHWRKLDNGTFTKAEIEDEAKNLAITLRGVIQEITAFRFPPVGYPQVRPLCKSCRLALDCCKELTWKLRVINEAAISIKKEKSAYESGPYWSLIYSLQELAKLIEALKIETDTCSYADYSKLLLQGDAGSGKSHLIADIIESARERSQPALLLLGEQFLGTEEPWAAAIKILQWNHSPDNLLAALDQEGAIAGRPALLCVDALNESEHRRLWQSHLIQFADRVSSYPNIKLLVSCRSDFIQITLPETIQPGSENAWPVLRHRGFGMEVIEAIQTYFNAYNVQVSHFPPFLDEFRNPLFLKVFCEAFEGRSLPSGPISFDVVMRARIKRLSEQIETEIDCDPDDTQAALMSIAKEIANNGGCPIPKNLARKKSLEHFPNRDASSSLYSRLLSNGMLVETLHYSTNDAGENEVLVRFPFERFSDYFIANQILDGVDTKAKFRSLFKRGEKLAFLRDLNEYYQNRGVARALAILAPERLQIELAELLSSSIDRFCILEDFLYSLSWRSANSISKLSETFLNEARDIGINLIPVYLKLSSIPEHPFNSEFLGKRLARMTLSDRELKWTIPVTKLSEWGHEGHVNELLDWCFRAPRNLIPDQQALLVGRLLLWFCTSNHRALRKRSTIAAIRLLVGRPSIVCQLIDELHDINDPYLLERLYATAAGVAMRLVSGEGLAKLAGKVHENIFSVNPIPANILIRDFAGCVLECAFSKKCLPQSICPDSFRPPFKSNWPSILSEYDIKRFEMNEGWDGIVSSVRNEEMGGYGDFGRYVMDASVHNFSDKLLTDHSPNADYRGQFSGLVARRWVLQRVEELGWTPEKFGEYERPLHGGRESPDIEEIKVERISKKYQWIALRELLGYLADHYWLTTTWYNESRKFEGAWQISAREFDPSQRLRDLSDEEENAVVSKQKWESALPNPFKDAGLCRNRRAWVLKEPEGISNLINLPNNTGQTGEDWLALAGHHEWVEPEYERVTEGRPGKLSMWVNVRSFLVRDKDTRCLINKLKEKHFYGNGCNFHSEYSGWIGEYPWGHVYRGLREWCRSPSDVWLGDCGIPYISAVCSWDEGGILIPSPQLCDLLEINWLGEGGRFVTRDGKVVTDYFGGEIRDQDHPLIVRRGVLNEKLKVANMRIVWCVLSEKRCWCSESSTHVGGKTLKMSAVYWLNRDKLAGGITQKVV